MPSVLCAVAHGLYVPWLEILKEGQSKTWLAQPTPDNVEIIHYHGTPLNSIIYPLDKIHERIRWSNRHMYRLLKLIDNLTLRPWINYIPPIEESSILNLENKVMHVRFPDLYLTHRWKILSLMNFFLNHTNHDYLFTTTTSSYINLEVLSQKIEEFEPGDLYFGALPYEGAEFISGSNRIFSRITVSKLLLAKHFLKPGIIEDLAVGQLLSKIGVKPTFIPLINISSIQELDNIQDVTLRENYHFRLKSGSNTRRDDAKIMRALHYRYGKAR